MGCKFRKVKYEKVKELGIRDKNLIFSPKSEYYAIIDDNTILSVLAVKEAKNGVKLQANYTFPEYRNRGLFTMLLKCVISVYEYTNIYADCLNKSIGIYIKQGFELYKIQNYSSFTIYKVRLLKDGKLCKKDQQSKNGQT